MCVRLSSSLIFSNANEGVGAKITRPIFPPPQWGHYLLMFCIFPRPSHSDAFFILLLLLGSPHCRAVMNLVHFQQLLKHNVFSIIEDKTVKPSMLRENKKEKWRAMFSEINGDTNSIRVKFLNIAGVSSFCAEKKYNFMCLFSYFQGNFLHFLSFIVLKMVWSNKRHLFSFLTFSIRFVLDAEMRPWPSHHLRKLLKHLGPVH